MLFEMPASIPACRWDCHSAANLVRTLGLWSVHTHGYTDVAETLPPVYLYPGFGLLLQQSNPADSPGSPRGSALLSSPLVWTGQSAKLQSPLLCPTREDLLMKTRP